MKTFFQILTAHFFLAVLVNSLQSKRNFFNSQLLIEHDQLKFVSDENSVNFLVIGDWGGLPVFPFRTIVESQVSNQMTKLGDIFNTKFQLALGDNFYFTGVKDENDKRFKETYFSVFNSKRLRETPWFVVLGNHDHYGNATAQVEYTKLHKNWILPSFNYTINVTDKNDQSLISILMIDTILLCGNSGFDWEYDKQPRFKSVREKVLSNAYLEAIEQELRRVSSTNVPYIIVAGHFPVWSVAEHGPTQCLLNTLRPLLHKYQVSAYFCGHDHNLQYISDTFLDHKVDYIVSGAGNFVENSTAHISDVPSDSLKYFWAENVGLINGGFMLTQTTSQNMTLTFYESNGKALYQNVIYPRKV